MVQWLRICLPMEGTQVQSLVRELRSHKPCGMAKKNLSRYKDVLRKKEPSRYKDVIGNGGKEIRGQSGIPRTDDVGYLWAVLGLSLQSHLDGGRNPS